MSRPPESTSMVVSAFASAIGSWYGSTITDAPSRTCLVSAATQASVGRDVEHGIRHRVREAPAVRVRRADLLRVDQMLGREDHVVPELVGRHGDVAQPALHGGVACRRPEARQHDGELHQARRACISNVLRNGPSRPTRTKA